MTLEEVNEDLDSLQKELRGYQDNSYRDYTISITTIATAIQALVALRNSLLLEQGNIPIKL